MGSRRAMVSSWRSRRNLMPTMPSGSRTPPRASSSAYISMKSGLMVGSTTTYLN